MLFIIKEAEHNSYVGVGSFEESKRPTFLCFQNIQAPKTTTVLKPFLLSFGTYLLFSTIVRWFAQCCLVYMIGSRVVTILEIKNLLRRGKMLGGVEWSHLFDRKSAPVGMGQISFGQLVSRPTFVPNSKP
jgi:Tfp pilus assembly protein PilZ